MAEYDPRDHGGTVYKEALRCLYSLPSGHGMELADLMQEGHMAAHKGMASYDPDKPGRASEGTWVTTCVRSWLGKIKDQAWTGKRCPRVLVRDDAGGFLAPEDRPIPHMADIDDCLDLEAETDSGDLKAIMTYIAQTAPPVLTLLAVQYFLGYDGKIACNRLGMVYSDFVKRRKELQFFLRNAYSKHYI
ncbi:MAG: hypothetical protein KMY53_15995 [Desulfarculus sp.]|nr:hypothetical protein [Pseudomonadota bacterium]MBU4599249.1 hypothetical protein [Pseudomonadota bacterium]MBV1715483.1 hypothetical protein [Desulfarculus sp.]MBV1739670.1 hypothetical protein [Desulfarculus sp.]